MQPCTRQRTAAETKSRLQNKFPELQDFLKFSFLQKPPYNNFIVVEVMAFYEENQVRWSFQDNFYHILALHAFAGSGSKYHFSLAVFYNSFRNFKGRSSAAFSGESK